MRAYGGRTGIKEVHCLLFLNGEYGDIELYRDLAQGADLVICADGGANKAHELGLDPDYLVGDMDSVRPEVIAVLKDKGAQIELYPAEKDLTDTQLALARAMSLGAQSITIAGGTGDRIDHTFSTIMSTVPLARRGLNIMFFHPKQRLFVTGKGLSIKGVPGDILSLIALEVTSGVNLKGLKYPLKDATLKPEHPFAVSNVFMGKEAEIDFKKGVLLVVHIPA